MKKITLKKVKYDHIQVLQSELQLYEEYVSTTPTKTNFYDCLLILDITNRLYFFLRDKLEQDKKSFTVNFTISQAATIVKCCYYNRIERNKYENNVMLMFVIEIDKQLRSLNNTTKTPLLQ